MEQPWQTVRMPISAPAQPPDETRSEPTEQSTSSAAPTESFIEKESGTPPMPGKKFASCKRCKYKFYTTFKGDNPLCSKCRGYPLPKQHKHSPPNPPPP